MKGVPFGAIPGRLRRYFRMRRFSGTTTNRGRESHVHGFPTLRPKYFDPIPMLTHPVRDALWMSSQPFVHGVRLNTVVAR